MTRLHADPVEVHTRTAPAGPEPDQFLWRGRRYLVREVLARWTESGGWWRGAAVRAVATGGPDAGPGAGDLDSERQWWRVEADSGRAAVLSGGTGVYDLCRDDLAGSWSLARVMD